MTGPARFRLRWPGSEEFPASFGAICYASFYTREEAFSWGQVLMRIGVRQVTVEAYRARKPPQQIELMYFLAGYYRQYVAKKHIPVEGMSGEILARRLARHVDVHVPLDSSEAIHVSR